MKKSLENGFTLVEVLVTSLILVPVLFAIISTQQIVGTTVGTNDRRADTADQVRKVARRLRQLCRPGLLSTIKVRALQADIDLATAAEAARFAVDPLGVPKHIPTMGEWISPMDLDPRENVQFLAADGVLSMNAAAVTSPRSFEFRMDVNEADNDSDDDGDGIVDEGKLYFQYNSQTFVLADNIENCSFTIENGTLLLFLQAARRDARGRVHRASIQQRIYMRNK